MSNSSVVLFLGEYLGSLRKSFGCGRVRSLLIATLWIFFVVVHSRDHVSVALDSLQSCLKVGRGWEA